MIDTSTISESSPMMNSTMESSNVSKLNDINDSKNNNNLSLNASMDTTLSLNNSSMDMTLHNASGTTNATSSSQKSHNDSFVNKSSQSVLKCML
jgi:hypothetical protein